jgi:hypothetical protein
MSSTVAETAIPITHYRTLTKEQPAAAGLLAAKDSRRADAAGRVLTRAVAITRLQAVRLPGLASDA